MSIAKQIHAFLEVSETFLRQSGTGLVNDELSSLEGVGSARDARTLMACVLLNWKTSANGGNGGGNSGGSGHGHGAIPARVQDSA
ncbi:hypothetical protein [Paraburkholderia elongata]|uniref:Uncharacterized protein n=1 Tax=Paraburkholderia elongata TaxID=2675747 RepID=A0A972SFD6_9BURK|nr:hypothetical protein [Paraburkholderia elongata]NPT53743.1 hypothetical protein [Paraburkholderia elongata]